MSGKHAKARRCRRLALSALAAAGLAGPILAQEPGSKQTRDFVQAAAQSDSFEIMEGRTALTQSADPRVRAFAQRMIDEHTRTMQALEQAATGAGLTPPPRGLSDDQARLLNELQSLNGPDFDQAYARHQALAHRSALVVEQGYARNGDQPAVRQAAAGATPLISGHLAMAEQLRAEVGGN